MPNWCENRLEIFGDDKSIKKFKDNVKCDDRETRLSLEKIKPLDRESSIGDIYDQWGTKWDVQATLSEESNEWLVYEFNSAWAPPKEALIDGSKKYPRLSFALHYDEPGMCFKGVFLVRNGDIVKDWYVEYDFPSE